MCILMLLMQMKTTYLEICTSIQSTSTKGEDKAIRKLRENKETKTQKNLGMIQMIPLDYTNQVLRLSETCTKKHTQT